MAALISVFFVQEDSTGLPGPPMVLVVLWTAIAAATWTALRAPRQPVSNTLLKQAWKQVLLGISGCVPFLTLVVIAFLRWPLVAYFAITLLWIAFYAWAMRHFAHIDHPQFGWFGLGWYVQIGVMSWLVLAPQNPLIIVIHVVIFAILFALLKWTRQT